MGAACTTTLQRLLTEEPDALLGALTAAARGAGFASLWHAQTGAWQEEIRILKEVAAALVARRREAAKWPVLLEFAIPRRGRRIDAVILAGGAIVVTEFKVGATMFDSASIWQAQDYALDLRDFHEASGNRPIFPVVVATDAPAGDALPSIFPDQHVARVARACPANLVDIALRAADHAEALGLDRIDPIRWDLSAYRPVLNIIQAAEAIFAGHQVREIAHAIADNLTETTAAIIEIVRHAQAEERRVLCLVTGVPGAGKTLTGLSAVHDPELRAGGRPAAVFLSGNGPLVKIVRAALLRDLRRQGKRVRESRREVETFIQNLHRFISEHGLERSDLPPPEHVVVFDEAQRAWDAAQMKRKRDVDRSEPEMMLEIMERCPGWCVIIALVGGGQEIHRGEAGLGEWGRALLGRPVPWEVVTSRDALEGGASLAGQKLFGEITPPEVQLRRDGRLHLRTSVRSFRCRVVTDWVNAVLCLEPAKAFQVFSAAADFPVVMTRDVDVARAWLRARAGEGKEAGLAGLVASSGAVRLRPYGIEVSSGFRGSYQFEEWFLRDAADVRSSSMLEVAATEFECQGLELDWVGICWGDDLTFDSTRNGWTIRQFKGTKWLSVRDKTNRQFILNKYRVLLTRARRGMIIWVPRGDPRDPTRKPEPLEETARYLRACGVAEIAGIE